MNLFFTLLPLFLFGNFHCATMCGPLVMLLARHPFKWHYFCGRLVSYSLVGLLCAQLGMVLFHFLSCYHLSGILSISFGITVCIIGFANLFKWRFRFSFPMPKNMIAFSQKLFTKASKNHSSAFFFGFCTILLPCGQTLMVFSLCALDAIPLHGLINGFFFALFTSPSLALAMYSLNFFQKNRHSFRIILALATLLIGALACLRGLAEWECISHLVLNPSAASKYHLIIF